MNDVMRKNNFVSGGPDFIPKHVIVGIIIRGGPDSSNSIQRIPAQGDCRAKRKANALEHVSRYDTRWHLNRHSQSFEGRPEIGSRIATVETRDQTQFLVEQWGNHIAQKVAIDPHIAIRDNKKITS